MMHVNLGAFFFMKTIFLTLILTFIVPLAYGQSDLEKMVTTERAFATAAVENGTKSAFLEFMAGDSVVFTPSKASGKAVWSARTETKSYLVWAPNFADISSNGILGYTTGNWQWAKGKTDEPTAFGNFVTVWLRQPSGQYRWVSDIGVDHAKPDKYTEELSPPRLSDGGNPRNIQASGSANRFYEIAERQGIAKAYAEYADSDIRFFRDNDLPGSGINALIERVKKSGGTIAFPKRSVFFESADIAYVNSSYTLTAGKGTTESGNFLQIWKFIDGRWKIVLDIFKSVPPNPN